ncbi:MAG: class I tRNA ligase family protein, partial [Flavobacteriaceae bacterium]|nr:class I tRNA ligase family protein [Flavobacteriaceae bacterium]
SVFDGIRRPDNPEINYYYPTQDLVTAPEILFFWVARMVMAGYEYRNEKPFENVYLTGIVRDKQRRKMSKSLGNSPDPLELIEKYGADGVRVGMLLSSPAGNDLMFDEDLCQQGKNFVNKIWNATRLISGWEVAETEQPEHARLGLDWFENKLQQSLIEIEDHFSKYRISDALMTTYKLVWDDFCSWLLEILKPEYGQPIDKMSYQSLIEHFESLLKLLHPFTPFITEEVWHSLKERSDNDVLIVARWPEKQKLDERVVEAFEEAKELISEIRRFRQEKNVSYKTPLELKLSEPNHQIGIFDAILRKMAGLSTASQVEKHNEAGYAFRVRTSEYFIPIAADSINSEEELEKMTKELQHAEDFLKSVRAKLNNERFINNAPAEVVDKERQKEADALKKIEILKRSIAALN